MKRTLRTFLLALVMLIGIGASAQASVLFPPTAVYDDRFIDVSADDWFYPNVAALYSLGLTNGKGDAAHFAPGSEVTLAEAVTMAARLRSLYDFGESEVGAGFFLSEDEMWYTPYFAYLRYIGIIGTEFDERANTPATRAEVAYLLANALPGELFEPINDAPVTIGYATGQYIRDVNDYTPYQRDILTLYRWGILNGTDSTGSFAPDTTIRRSEIAAIISRLVDSDLRINLKWEIREDREIYSLTDLVESSGTFFPAPEPEDTAAIDADIRYMLARGERKIELDYTLPQTEQKLRALMDAFLVVMRTYPEQTYNKINLSYSTTNGKVSIRFSSSLYEESMIDAYRESIFTKALVTREQLYANGTLHAEMTQYEKAKAYFNWLCNNCEYDHNSQDNSISHSAYGAFQNRLAVCDGYTAAYNLLLKLEGIECRAVDREDWDHMWTVAVLDGVSYHIDATWGDQTGTASEYYFAMTEETSLARFH
ncbi:MAG: S-layer homology domain-containing protein [Oscillospiraceae bacterium]|nr:S-layer homology domain-containing protein [Oscillospiraceae bacterium]